jgi:hypothetical protein
MHRSKKEKLDASRFIDDEACEDVDDGDDEQEDDDDDDDEPFSKVNFALKYCTHHQAVQTDVDPIEDARDIRRPNLFLRIEEDAEELRKVAASFVERSRVPRGAPEAISKHQRALERIVLSYQDSPIYRMRVKARCRIDKSRKFSINLLP